MPQTHEDATGSWNSDSPEEEEVCPDEVEGNLVAAMWARRQAEIVEAAVARITGAKDKTTIH